MQKGTAAPLEGPVVWGMPARSIRLFLAQSAARRSRVLWGEPQFSARDAVRIQSHATTKWSRECGSMSSCGRPHAVSTAAASVWRSQTRVDS